MIKIKICFSLTLIFLFHGNIFGAGSKYETNFKRNWSYTPLISRTEKDSVFSTKYFKRYLWIGKNAVPVAQTNFTFLKNPREDVNLNAITENIKNSFSDKEIKVTKNKNKYVITGKWKKINRNFRIDLIKQNKNFIMLTSFYRSGFEKQLRPEIAELHDYLKKYKSTSDKANDKNKLTTFLNFFIPEVYAIDFGDITGDGSSVELGGVDSSGEVPSNGTPSDNFLNSSGTTTFDLADLLTNFEADFKDFNNNTTSVNNTWNNTNNKVGEALTKVDTVNSNWSKTNQTLSEVTGKIDTVTSKIDNVNSNWAETNNLIGRTLDPNRMAKIAYYTAAGAALGSLSVSLAIEGISTGVSFLYELITQSEKKKLEWQDFEKAMQAWDTQIGDLTKLEQVVDQMVLAFDFFEEKKLGNNYINNIKLAIRDMKFDRDMLLEKFNDKGLNLTCRKAFYDASDEIDQKVKEYEKLLNYSLDKKIVTDNESPQNYFCQQLKDMQKKILGLEVQIQDLRLAILKAESQFYDKEDEQLENRKDKTADINDELKDTLEKRNDFDQKTKENFDQNLKKEKSDWIAQCEDGENEEGKRIDAEIDNAFLHFFKASSLCEESYNKNLANKKFKKSEKASNIAQMEGKLREKLILGNNKIIDLKFSESQLNWLSKIHMDAYCYQFTHDRAENIPEKCLNFPEVVYSMSLSRAFDKAHKAYGDRCSDHYLEGLSKLSSGK